ncbi:ankyrin repeat domain-containing protein [Legionella sp. 16cNR16C]|uniref:ankyrin repeat domain-containing protein n=1 Tax=Legionella sp. 16cNR16C TaxID=2905656 RepID=UPI001E520949|nr:ankyrin repeat domain-containing protein [Legionella sp. 16cNR16C]MCE3044633.1 ankyrin repeat domain-containing protein [Legionella sp. 16cNR16C]
MKGFFGPASWETRLRQLQINPDEINERDLETIINYFRRNIKSDLQPQQTITALKHLYESYERIKNKNALDETLDFDSSLIVFSYAAKNGMDRFLIQAWPHSNNEVRKNCLQHVNNFNNSALHLASINGHPQVIRFLLQLNMSAMQANMAGKLPIMLALQCHNIAMRQECYREFSHILPEIVQRLDAAGENILFYLLRAQMEDEALDVLQKNPSTLQAINDEGETLLHLALLLGLKKIYQPLLRNKAMVEYQTLHNQTILHYAVAGGYVEAVTAVLTGKFNLIDKQDRKLNTALHLAAGQSNGKMIELLLAHGARTDLCNEHNKLAADLASNEYQHLLQNRTPGMSIH